MIDSAKSFLLALIGCFLPGTCISADGNSSNKLALCLHSHLSITVVWKICWKTALFPSSVHTEEKITNMVFIKNRVSHIIWFGRLTGVVCPLQWRQT